MLAIATVGVYEFDAPSVRRLQGPARHAHIGYEHRPETAPTTESRHLQYRDDDRQGVGKRSRVRLSPEYIRGSAHGIGALLCVEATAGPCHRSLAAERLVDRFRFEVVHPEPTEPMDVDLI